VGRFQIFHLGHLDVLRHIAAAPDVDEILVAIGSTQYDHRRRHPDYPWRGNPFTLEERREMIERSLEGALAKPYSIHPVPDLHDPPRWVLSIEEHLPAFFCLYTRDAEEKRCFEARGKEVRSFPTGRPFHAGVIRGWIASGQEYRHAVPEGTSLVLERIGAAARIRALVERDLAEAGGTA